MNEAFLKVIMQCDATRCAICIAIKIERFNKEHFTNEVILSLT